MKQTFITNIRTCPDLEWLEIHPDVHFIDFSEITIKEFVRRFNTYNWDIEEELSEAYVRENAIHFGKELWEFSQSEDIWYGSVDGLWREMTQTEQNLIVITGLFGEHSWEIARKTATEIKGVVRKVEISDLKGYETAWRIGIRYDETLDKDGFETLLLKLGQKALEKRTKKRALKKR